jgi:hypothetical protein
MAGFDKRPKPRRTYERSECGPEGEPRRGASNPSLSASLLKNHKINHGKALDTVAIVSRDIKINQLVTR